MKLLVIIPAHNEEHSLPTVIDNFTATCPGMDYLVVNDGSTDDTAGVCRRNGYNLLDLPINLGLAGAFQAGVVYALQHGYEAALQFDADGQHLPEYIPLMLSTLQQGYDIVIGSRYVTRRKPISLRMFGSFIISFAMRAVVRTPAICDPTSGMRMYNRKVLAHFARDVNYTPEPDTICYLMHSGAKVCEVQVEMAERFAGTSYFTALGSIKYMAQMAISILLVQWFRRNDFKQEGNGFD